MKKAYIAATMIAAALCRLAAADPAANATTDAPAFSFSGVVDPYAAYSSLNENSAFASVEPLSDATVYGEIDGKLRFSREYTSLGLLDFSFRDTAQIDHSDGSTTESKTFTVNELYSDLNFGDRFYLRIGKQRLSWGAGYVFNPSDPVNPPKDPTNQRAILEGVPAVKVELIDKPVSLMLFSVLYDSFDQFGYGAKLSTSALPNSDISLSGYWSASQSWTGALNASVAPFYALPGWDTIQTWFEGGVYGQGRYEAYADGILPGSAATENPTGAQYAALFGASGQIPVLETVALAEYYHLSEGLSPSELGSVYGALRSPSPAIVAASSSWYSQLALRPGRQASDYLFLSLTQSTITDTGDPVFDKIGLTLSCLLNLVDGSFYLQSDLSLTFVKDTSIDATLAWAAGGPDTEFGNDPVNLCLGLEAKVFF